MGMFPFISKNTNVLLLIFSITCFALGIYGIITSFTKSTIEYIPDLE